MCENAETGPEFTEDIYLCTQAKEKQDAILEVGKL